MRKHTTKLKIHKETLRRLSREEAAHAKGAAALPADTWFDCTMSCTCEKK